MKNIVVILFFYTFIELLVLGAQIDEQKREWINECLYELILHTPTIDEQTDPGENACFVACMMKKLNTNKNETLQELVKRAIDEKEISKELHDKLVDKLDDCAKKAEDDDCKFIGCVNVFDDPFLTLLKLRNLD